MANANRPSGLAPVGYLSGADWDGRGRVYAYLAAGTDALYIGDQVVIDGGGTSKGIPTVAKVADGNNACTGAIIGIGLQPTGPYVDPNNLSRVFRPAGAQAVDYYLLVADDPSTIFEIQEDSVGGAMTAASIGLNKALVSAAPATGVVVSGTQIDSSAAGDANGTVKIMRLVQRVDNAIGEFAKWLVIINNHTYKAPTASI